MGQISVSGPYSGKSYPIIIAGDVPTDEEYGRISEYIRTQEAAVKADLENKYGDVEGPDDGTAIGRAYRRASGSGSQAIGDLIETVGQKTGIAALADYGTDYAEEARQELGQENILQSIAQRPVGRYQDVNDFSTGLEYLGGLVGGTGSSLESGLKGGIAGGIAGSVIPGAGTLSGFGAGFTAGLVPEFAGKNIQAQEAVKGEDNVSLTTAVGTAVAQALAERLGLKAMAAMGISPNAVGKKVTQRILSGAFKGGGTEALTETFQTAAERLQSGAPMDQVFDEEGIDQLKNAFVGGALLGTGIGGAAGGIRGPRPEPIIDPNAVPPAADPQLDLGDPVQAKPTSNVDDLAFGPVLSDAEKLAEYDALMAPLREVVLDSKGEKIKEESPLEKAKREYEEANPVSKPAAKAPKETQLDLLDENKAKSPTTAAERADNRVFAEADTANNAFDKVAQAAATKAKKDKERADAAQARADKTKAAKDLKEAEAAKKKADKAALVAKKAQERADKAKAKTEPRTAEPTVEEDTSEIDLAANLAASKAQTETDQGRDVEGVETSTGTVEVEETNPVDPVTVDSTKLRTFKEYLVDKIDANDVKAAEFIQSVASPEDIATARTLGFDIPNDNATYADIVRAITPSLKPVVEPRTAGDKVEATPIVEPVVEPRTAGDKVEATPAVEPVVEPVVEPDTTVEDIYTPNVEQQYIDGIVTPVEPRTAGDKVEAAPVVEPEAKPVVPDTVEASLDRDAVGVGAVGRGFKPEDVPAGIKGVDSTPKPVEPTTEPIAAVEARDNVTKAENKTLQERIRSIIINKYIPKTYKSAAVDRKTYGKLLIAAAYVIDPETGNRSLNYMDPTSIADKEQIIFLLEATPKELKAKFTDPELYKSALAARKYFAVSLNAGLAIDELAHDIVYGSTKSSSEAGMSVEQQVFNAGRNKPAAFAAKDWLEEFLEPETFKYYKDRVRAEIEVQAGTKAAARRRATADTERSKQAGFEEAFADDNVAKGSNKSQAAAFRKAQEDLEAQAEADRQRDNAASVTLGARVSAVPEQQGPSKAGFTASKKAKAEAAFNKFVEESGLFKPLPTESVVYLDDPMSPSAMGFLGSGMLKETLYAIAQGTNYPKLAKIANKLADMAGTTKIVFVPDLVDMDGAPSAGQFDPRTNTISINPKSGMNTHTVLHEMVHAAVSASLAKNSASTLALRNVFNDVKDVLDTEYGATNLDEFISEALTNPAFQEKLGQLVYKGDLHKGKTALQRLYNAITNFVRRMIGLQPKPLTSALSEIDYLIEGMLAPAPQFRDADSLALMTPAAANGFLNSAITNGPIFNNAGKTRYLAWIEDAAKNVSLGLFGGANKFLMQATPLHYLADISEKDFGDLGAKLNTTVNEANGAYGKQIDELKNTLLPIVQWGKANKGLQDQFNRMVNEATRREVDPVLDRPAAVKKYGKDPEKMANWEQVRSDYEALVNASPAVVRIYATMRNLFRGLRNDIRNAVDERLTIAIPDGAVRARVMKSFYDKLTSKGTIEPYTPLEREGDLWIYYNGVDPVTGNLERYAESFTTPAERARAWAETQEAVRSGIRSNQKLMASMAELVRQKKHANIEEAIDAQIGVTEAASISEVNFNNAPPASFIAQLTKQIRDNSPSDTKEQRETTNKIINEIGELVLNTIPETSYMQSFRTRKGTLGNIEDAIRATTKRATLLGRQAVQMKYGNKFDAIKVELQAAYDKAGGEGNTTPAMRDMYDTLVSFADSGTGVNRSNFSKMLTNIGFNMTLGFNVSGALVNLSQIPLTVFPVYGAKYGYDKTSSAIGEAMRLIHNSGRKRMVEVYGDKVDAEGNPIKEMQEVTGTPADRSVSNYDYANETDPRKKRMQFAVGVGERLGLFKRTLAYDMLDIDGTNGGMEKFNAASGFMLHHGERINREVAFTAAYNLEADILDAQAAKDNRTVSDAEYEQAAEKAFYMVEMTNGGSASAASPQIMQGSIGSVVFMYKRYGVSMLSLLHKLAKEGMVGQSAEAKKLAAYQLAGIYGSAALMSGVRGVPFFGAAAMVYNLLKDDDEESMQSIVRRVTGEGYYSGAVNYVTGTNVATRIQLSDLLFRDTLIDRDQPAIWTAVEMLGGPAIGIALQMDRAADLFAAGEFARGAEAFAPSAARNVMKSVRFYKDGGAETLAGDIIAPVHPLHAVAQALGFIPAELARAYELNAEIKSMEKGTKSRRKRILDEIARARADGDNEAEQAAYDKIPAYNAEHPDWPINGKSIEKSMNSRAENTSKKFQGISIHPKLRDTYMDFADQFSGKATMF